MGATDYNRVDPDADKDPSEYHYTERRAEILDLIEQAGSPKRLDTQRLAERYGVTRSQIYQDIDRLGEFVAEALGTRAKMRTQALYERVLDELMDEGEYREAWRTTMEWNEWLAERGAIERAPSKHEVDADVTTREAATETEDYVLVEENDDAVELAEEPDADSEA